MKSPPCLSSARDEKEFKSPRMAHSQPFRKDRSIWRLMKAIVDLSSLEPWPQEGNLGAIAAVGP